jgi:hypothetical protein
MLRTAKAQATTVQLGIAMRSSTLSIASLQSQVGITR